MQQFPIGTQFVPFGNRRKNTYTVTDFWVTRNLAGEIVKERYIATYDFMGQTITDYDIVPATIARGLLAEGSTHATPKALTGIFRDLQTLI